MAQDFIEIQKYLSGVDYPASKDQLLKHADEKGAPKEIKDKLAAMPDGQYDGPNRVSKAVTNA
jgi:Protein of unknown function (DUF2795)